MRSAITSLLFGICTLLMACSKDQPIAEDCKGKRVFQLSDLSVRDGFMPMDTRFFWLYADTSYVPDGNPRFVTSLLMTPRQSFVSENEQWNGGPFMAQDLLRSYLPDLAFFKDTVYILNNFFMLRHGDCHEIGRAWLYPLAHGDTAVLEDVSGIPDVLYRSPERLETPFGVFANNYVLRKYGGAYEFVFNREVGLLQVRIFSGEPDGSLRLLRKVVLLNTNVDSLSGS